MEFPRQGTRKYMWGFSASLWVIAGLYMCKAKLYIPEVVDIGRGAKQKYQGLYRARKY